MKMKNPTKSIFGIHHVTAISSDTQRNIDFYTNNLGLRLVKQTVNHDDPPRISKMQLPRFHLAGKRETMS
jgi:catechol 2,3-dioxygenase-like lactoylglutathione lyase family enzyme